MGCFTVLKCRKKRSVPVANWKPIKQRVNSSTALPEPEYRAPSLQSAPPSFRTRVKPAQSVDLVTNSRSRALSAPSSIHMADRDALSLAEQDERFSSPLPLPLPSPEGPSLSKNAGSFKSNTSSDPISTSGPLPLPPLAAVGLRNFSLEELSAACQNFSIDRCVSEGLSSTAYKASFGDDNTSSKKFEATVTRLFLSSQGLKDFVNEVYTLANLQHPYLCKLLGFHAREGSDQRMLVYERLFHGSLDRLLHGRSDGPSIDWSSRMKVALCAAKGLAFLHEDGPFQAMYNEFSTANIQVDKDFTAKLSGYGCVSYNPETDISSNSMASANLSVETLEKGLLTPKSNVWSFGIVLLELLTGRRNFDSHHPKEERNIVKWSRPFLTDDCRLLLIMDPRIKGRVPPKAARTIADVVLKCLQREPSERPTMRAIVEALKSVQDMKYPCRFPLQEPSAAAGKQMLKSPSLNCIVGPTVPLNYSPPQLSVTRHVSSLLPPRVCSSPTTEDSRITSIQKLPSPTLARPRVGF